MRKNHCSSSFCTTSESQRQHAPSITCSFAVDARVRIHRTHEGDVQRTGQADVVNVVRQPFDKAGILGSLNSFSNVLGHASSTPGALAAAEVSTRLMRACAYIERTKATCS